jgi:hypothetical protein
MGAKVTKATMAARKMPHYIQRQHLLERRKKNYKYPSSLFNCLLCVAKFPIVRKSEGPSDQHTIPHLGTVLNRIKSSLVMTHYYFPKIHINFILPPMP